VVRPAQAVRRLDPAALWSSINGNHLPPVGASLVHPRLQSAHDAYGPTSQRFSGRAVGRMGGRAWILLGGEHGHQVVLKVLSRSTPEPKYRSDATYLARIYGEALIDLSPEEVADSVRPRF